ncbi:dimethylarginine dimethylaminohydrolase family protein [Rhodococcus wratislaviensis]|uniref:dimethylarginine dimethylaminohydrolase family protein n=1 Tax=Rhodococcus wratislaviensis TaxID=44752 RepID=UPI00364F06B3
MVSSQREQEEGPGREEKAAMKPIGVPNEWGKLREVIVGVLPDDALVPAPTHFCYEYMVPATLELLRTYQGQLLRDVAPQAFDGTTRQLEGLVQAYQDTGVQVHRGRPWTTPEQQYLAYLAPGGFPVFVRDPILVVGNHAIELAVKTPFRRREIFSIRELLQQRVAEDPHARYVSMPTPVPVQPTRHSDGPGPFLEGGDIFVMGHDVLVGNSGLASDRAGIDWLQRYLGPEGYHIHEVALTKNWLHLDCIFAVVRRGLCICDTSGLADGLPSILEDWEVIAATPEEAHALGCNTMCLEENVVLMAQEHTRLIAELEKRQANVVSGFGMDIASQWGGGIRCASHPLHRDE